MKLFSRRTDNGFHNSRQVAKCPANLIGYPIEREYDMTIEETTCGS